jgi:hypothetical protein
MPEQRIEDEQRVVPLRVTLEQLQTVLGLVDHIAVLLESVPEKSADLAFVVPDEDAGHRRRSGHSENP